MTHTDRLRLAVFIDFDNIEIGVKNTLGGASFDAGLVLEALKERGEVVAKTAYSDWQRAGGYSRMLTQHAIRMVQRNMTPGGDKNGADINLALDALEMAFTHPHINAFVIVGGDSDFISLVEKLKQYDKKVFVVGGRQFTSAIMQRNCHEFIAYENLIGSTAVAASTGGGPARRDGGRDRRPERAAIGIDQAIPLVTRALKVLSEREVSPQIGLLKSTLLQLDSTFSERNYGAGSFRDFVQRLETAGLVRLQQHKGGWLVEPADGAVAVEAAATSDDGLNAPAVPAPTNGHANGGNGAVAIIGTPADGVRELKRVLESAEIRRWPLYLRNVKQLLRQPATRLDERAYGFGGLVDLLRAAQKEDVVRVDRDRHGVIRVFQGTGTPMAAPPVDVITEVPDADAAVEIVPDVPVDEPQPQMAARQPDELELPGDNIGNVVPDPTIPKARRRRSGGATAGAARPARARRPRSKA